MEFDLNTYEGLRAAVKWQTRMVSMIKEGGSWIVPRSGSVYVLYHTQKKAFKMMGSPEPDITRVFEEMGWTVKEY